MVIWKSIFSICVLLFGSVFAQSSSVFEQMETAYKKSNYIKAIELSEVVLKKELTKTEAIKTNEIRGVCFYSMGKKDSSKIAFTNVLEIDDTYYPNKLFISPKIILFFESVKMDYERLVSNRKIESFQNRADSTDLKENWNRISKAITYSILLPGTGHLTTGQKTKGWLLTGASTTLLGGAICFLINTNRLERDYQSESNKKLIQEKYDVYNKSYKIRNLLLASYGAVWLFTQLDILVFNQEKLFGNNLSVLPSVRNTYNSTQLSLSFTYSF